MPKSKYTYMATAFSILLLSRISVAEESIIPTFEASENDQSSISWKTRHGVLQFQQDCSIESISDSAASGLWIQERISLSESPDGPYRMICRVGFKSLPEMTVRFEAFNKTVTGFVPPLSPVPRLVQEQLAQGRPITLKNYNALMGGVDNSVDIVLGSSAEYVILIEKLKQKTEEKNIAFSEQAAQQREYRINRAEERAVERKRQEQNRVFGAIFLTTLSLAIVFWLLRSGVLQPFFSLVTGSAAKANLKAKRKFHKVKRISKRKKDLKAAKELALWSDLYEKGHITQEELQERKKDILSPDDCRE